MSKITRFWQINGLYELRAERISHAQPLAHKFEQVTALDYSQLLPEQQQALFDLETYQAQGFSMHDVDLQASRVLTHVRLLQHIAANPSIEEQDLVMIMESGTILATHWYRSVQLLERKFTDNPKLNCVYLANQFINNFNKLDIDELEEHHVLTQEHLIESLNDPLADTDLCYVHNLHMTGASAYIIRKSAITTFVQQLVDVNAILTQTTSNQDNKLKVSWMAEAFYKYFDYKLGTIAYLNPCVAVNLYGLGNKYPNYNSIENQDVARIKAQQYLSHYATENLITNPYSSSQIPSELFNQQQAQVDEALELMDEKLHPYVQEQHLANSIGKHPQQGYNYLARVKKYVLTDQGFRTEQHNQLDLFYSQDHTDDFIPVFYPRERDADLQAYYQAYPASFAKDKHVILGKVSEMRLAVAFRRLFSQVISDPSLSDQDYILVTQQDYRFRPDWYYQLNLYLNFTNILFPENNLLCLSKPSYENLAYIEEFEFTKYKINTQEDLITNLNYTVSYASQLQPLSANPYTSLDLALKQNATTDHPYLTWSSLTCPLDWISPNNSFSYTNAQFITLSEYTLEEQLSFLIRVGCLRKAKDYIFGEDFHPYNLLPIVNEVLHAVALANPPFSFRDQRLANLRLLSHYSLPEIINTNQSQLELPYSNLHSQQVPDYLSSTPKFLINLEKETDRLRFMQTQEGLDDFRVVPAVDAREFSLEQLGQFFNLEKFAQTHHRQPITGEIGCTLSHCKIYQQVLADQNIADDQWVMIIEDDCKFIQGWQEKVNLVLHYLNQYQLDQVNLVLLAHIMLPAGKHLAFPNLANTTYIYVNEHSPYTIAPGLDLNFLTNFFPHGSSCYLVRKGALRKYAADINYPYWLADNFPYCIEFKHGSYALINPAISDQNYELESIIAKERNEMERIRRQQLRQIPLYASDVEDYLTNHKYVIQKSLSDEELAAKFPLDKFKVVKYADYKQLSDQEFAKVYDREGFKANYDRYPTDDEINRALTHYQIYQDLTKGDNNSIRFYLVVEDDVILTDDYLTNANILIRYVDTRLDLGINFIQLSSKQLGNFGKQKLSCEELQAHKVYIEQENLYDCNPELQIGYCNAKYPDGCKMYIGLNIHLRLQGVTQKPISWLADDFPVFITFHEKTIAYSNPCLGIDLSV